jgi:hypothetical protein
MFLFHVLFLRDIGPRLVVPRTALLKNHLAETAEGSAELQRHSNAVEPVY